MNLSDIRTAIANTLSGVVNSTGYPPVNVSTAGLPIAVLLLHRLELEPRGIGGNVVYTLTFRVELLISPVAQSTPESVIAIAEGKLEDAVDALIANPTLDGKVDHLTAIDSDGVHVLAIGGTDYYSALFRVTYVIK
jgi:hypothetical protein